MKLLFIVINLFAFVTIIQGQDTDFNPATIPFSYVEQNLQKCSKDQRFTFSDIQIIDSRTDTSKIGYWATNSKPFFEKLNFKGGRKGLRENLVRYYASAFDSSDNVLLIVIKKLWISQYDTLFAPNSWEVYTGRDVSLQVKMEFYLQNGDRVYPIIRKDSVWHPLVNATKSVAGYRLVRAHMKKEDFEKDFINGIIRVCGNVLMTDPFLIKQRRKNLPVTEIYDKLNRDNNLPILQAPLKKGVFKTFNDFLQNQPTSDFVSIERAKYGDVLIIKDESDEAFPTNNVWGFYDGQHLYITSGHKFFKLIRVENTYEFFGIKNLKERFNYHSTYSNPNGQSSSMLHKKLPKLRLFPYQVDMATGEVN